MHTVCRVRHGFVRGHMWTDVSEWLSRTCRVRMGRPAPLGRWAVQILSELQRGLLYIVSMQRYNCFGRQEVFNVRRKVSLRDIHACQVQGRHVRGCEQRLPRLHAVPAWTVHGLWKMRRWYGGNLPAAEDMQGVQQLQRWRVQAQRVHWLGVLRPQRVRSVRALPCWPLSKQALRRVWIGRVWRSREKMPSVQDMPCWVLQGGVQRVRTVHLAVHV